MGILKAHKGDLDEAIGHYFEALQINPRSAQAHIGLASALRKQGKFYEAAAHYKEALRLKPDNTMIRRNLEALEERNASEGASNASK